MVIYLLPLLQNGLFGQLLVRISSRVEVGRHVVLTLLPPGVSSRLLLVLLLLFLKEVRVQVSQTVAVALAGFRGVFEDLKRVLDVLHLLLFVLEVLSHLLEAVEGGGVVDLLLDGRN